MGAEEGAKCLTDIAKIVEEKAKDIDRCHMVAMKLINRGRKWFFGFGKRENA